MCSSDLENSVFVVLAKLDHILYKSRTYNSIVSLKHLLEAENTHECDLGHWYDNEGKERFSDTTSYAKISAPHHIVHTNANKNLTYLDGDAAHDTLDNSCEIIDNFDEMEVASTELFTLLDSMLQESK